MGAKIGINSMLLLKKEIKMHSGGTEKHTKSKILISDLA